MRAANESASAGGLRLAAGMRLGPYEIVAPLGAGGMGEVYRAHDARLGRDVAIKIISDRGSRDPQLISRFQQEAKAVAAVSHPNILAIHDFGAEGSISFAVMELLRGDSLEDRLARERLPWRSAVEIAAAVADGLAAAHSRGIIHRDLKPANIFLTEDGQVKILDFGLAKRVAGPADALSKFNTETQPGMVAGTAGYMSPEQVTAAAVDARSDIFALGSILYEMVSGQRAFRRQSLGESLAAILRDTPPDLSESGQQFPAGIASVVRRCLQKNPDDRFQSARDLSFALKQILGGSEVFRAPAVPSRWIAAVLAVALVTAASILAFHFRRRIFGPPGIRSVAVLPLRNMTGDPGQEYLADGMTDQLIANLARIGDVRVTSLTSSMSYKGKHEPLPQIARELGVDSVVDGSVTRSADRIRITTELIDAATDKHLWSETFERDVKDVAAVQREIALSVARNIHVELSPLARSRLEDERSIDPRSFDAFIRGRYAFTKGSSREAAQYFQVALDADPTNADAYAGFAAAYARMGYANDLSPNDSFPKAKAAAGRALELDPNSAEAHATLAYIHMYYDWDFPAADAEFRKALALNPSLADAHQQYAVYLAAMLRAADAKREAAAARTLDPLSVPVATDSGFIMYYERDYDKATKALNDAIAMKPDAWLPHFWLARVYQAEKKYVEAEAEYKASDKGLQRAIANLAGLGHFYAIAGKRNEALKILAQIERASKTSYVTPYAATLIYLGLGDKEKTLAGLHQCLEERTNWLVWLLKDPRWDPMRSDPRFQSIVRKVGFPLDAQSRQPTT